MYASPFMLLEWQRGPTLFLEAEVKSEVAVVIKAIQNIHTVIRMGFSLFTLALNALQKEISLFGSGFYNVNKLQREGISLLYDQTGYFL